MNLDFSEKDEEFRTQVRAFLEQNYPSTLRELQARMPEVMIDSSAILLWQKVLAKKGWVAPGWPAQWGGTDWTPTQHFIFTEELARANTVTLPPFGLGMLAPVLWTYGTKEQQTRFLPDIYHGNVWWCQGYSEPGAGSDLASLRMKAERQTDSDGKEYYIVNGQKTWTTLAQHADWGFFLVRTRNDVKPQLGISFLLIDMRSPGVTVKAVTTVEGGHEVNDVFLDNVKVPIENRIHDENKGWDCAKALLAHERTSIAGVAKARVGLQKLKDMAKSEQGDNGKSLFDDSNFRRKITLLELELDALAMTELRVIAKYSDGRQPGPESSILKIRGTEIRQQLSKLMLEAVGYDAMPYITISDENDDVINAHAMRMTWNYLNNRKLSIYGGSNEIQRNIIAKRVLAL